MLICSNYKNCICLDCPFNKPYEERQDDGDADCNGNEVKAIEYKEL
jgi:hypothetical protein